MGVVGFACETPRGYPRFSPFPVFLLILFLFSLAFPQIFGLDFASGGLWPWKLC
jgi:hypothetical protein